MNILMVLAHPDDEVIFGWPAIFLGSNLTLLTLSHNKERHGDGPVKALEEVCKINNINLIDVPRSENNFYRLPTRFTDNVLKDTVHVFRTYIAATIKAVQPDYIFTHNPMGEYGHGDHRLVFNLVSQFPNPLLFTDICFSNACHLSSDNVPELYSKYLFQLATERMQCKLDMEWYNEMKAIYEKYKGWTWGGHDPITYCDLFLFS